jgi:DNA repair protein RadD
VQLRPHQSDLLDRTRTALIKHRSVLMYAPPGAGKTVIAAAMAHGASLKRKRVIFACHRAQILEQTALTFRRFNIDFGYIAAGMPANPFASAQIASIDTLRNRLVKWPTDVLVVDECHLAGARTWSDVISHYRDTGAMVVGLSGSPCRLDGKPLRSNFAHMEEGPQVAWLIDNGYLSRYRAFAPSRMDTTGVHVRAGDYVVAELEDKFDKPSIIGDAVMSWRKFASGKRTVVYSFSIEHSRHVVDTFRAAGITADHMDGKTEKSERRRIISEFADGKIQVLSSVDILTTGFDLSAQVGRDVPIECVQMLRPTKSLALAIQMMGRGLRPKSYPAILLDHAGIMREHGLPDDPREWSLDGPGVNKRTGEATIATVTCHECFGIYRPQFKCPYCGAIRQVSGREIEFKEGELNELDIEKLRQIAQEDFERRQKHAEHVNFKIEERAAGTDLAKWEAIAKKRGHARGWAFHRCVAAKQKRAG